MAEEEKQKDIITASEVKPGHMPSQMAYVSVSNQQSVWTSRRNRIIEMMIAWPLMSINKWFRRFSEEIFLYMTSIHWFYPSLIVLGYLASPWAKKKAAEKGEEWRTIVWKYLVPAFDKALLFFASVAADAVAFNFKGKTFYDAFQYAKAFAVTVYAASYLLFKDGTIDETNAAIINDMVQEQSLKLLYKSPWQVLLLSQVFTNIEKFFKGQDIIDSGDLHNPIFTMELLRRIIREKNAPLLIKDKICVRDKTLHPSPSYCMPRLMFEKNRFMFEEVGPCNENCYKKPPVYFCTNPSKKQFPIQSAVKGKDDEPLSNTCEPYQHYATEDEILMGRTSGLFNKVQLYGNRYCLSPDKTPNCTVPLYEASYIGAEASNEDDASQRPQKRQKRM